MESCSTRFCCGTQGWPFQQEFVIVCLPFRRHLESFVHTSISRWYNWCRKRGVIWVWPGNEYWSCFWSRFYHWAGDSVLPFSLSLSDVIPVKSSWNFVEKHEHQATVLPSVLYWEIYPCVWVCLFIRIFISHLHEKHSRTRLQNLTLVFLYLYNFTNASSSSDISARYFGVNKTLSPSIIQLFRERLSEKLCMRQSRNRWYGIWSIHRSWHCGCRIYFCCFPLTVTNIRAWPVVPLFQIFWRAVNSQPPIIPFGVVACTFPDNLSRNSCIKFKTWHHELAWGNRRNFASLLVPAKRRLRWNEPRNSILMTCHYPDLGSASDWSCSEGNLLQPIRSTIQIWVVTRHQYGISSFVSRVNQR